MTKGVLAGINLFFGGPTPLPGFLVPIEAASGRQVIAAERRCHSRVMLVFPEALK